ncbi:MAG: D-amino-acid transaminase [Methylobacteriaceae bacterium]|nr:D-amino-acid transaminase [Methylobacteriaceae bacterium]
MSEIVFVDGAYVERKDARVSIFDRGFLFADGIYEVCAVLDGKLVDNSAHLARLDRSLAAIELACPMSHAEIVAMQRELVARNALREGLIYMQVTRGVADRDFAFPEGATPTFVAFAQHKRIIGAPAAETGVAAISVPDLRWARRDIKSIALLAQVLAKQQARKARAAEAFMVEDGFVTEGASSTAFIVTKADEIVTRPLSNALLPGCTRQAILALARERGMKLVERAFTIEEACEAAECFFTSATAFVMPVVSLDGRTIGQGRPGPATRRLRELYIAAAREEAE